MHECTCIIINSFHLFPRTLFNKGFFVEGVGWGTLIVQMKENTGRGGVKPISMLTLKNILKHFYFCNCIYICVNNMTIFYAEFTKE